MAHFEEVVTFIFCEVNQKGKLKPGNFHIENNDDDIKLFISTVWNNLSFQITRLD
tara:strand:- start:1087 stop:1251 length:165 start_codon:yes stop_codon:yes gene_type:complete